MSTGRNSSRVFVVAGISICVMDPIVHVKGSQHVGCCISAGYSLGK